MSATQGYIVTDVAKMQAQYQYVVHDSQLVLPF